MRELSRYKANQRGRRLLVYRNPGSLDLSRPVRWAAGLSLWPVPGPLPRGSRSRQASDACPPGGVSLCSPDAFFPCRIAFSPLPGPYSRIPTCSLYFLNSSLSRIQIMTSALSLLCPAKIASLQLQIQAFLSLIQYKFIKPFLFYWVLLFQMFWWSEWYFNSLVFDSKHFPSILFINSS